MGMGFYHRKNQPVLKKILTAALVLVAIAGARGQSVKKRVAVLEQNMLKESQLLVMSSKLAYAYAQAQAQQIERLKLDADIRQTFYQDDTFRLGQRVRDLEAKVEYLEQQDKNAVHILPDTVVRTGQAISVLDDGRGATLFGAGRNKVTYTDSLSIGIVSSNFRAIQGQKKKIHKLVKQPTKP